MDKSEVIKILRNEETCVRAADNCGRDCANCHLVMDDKAILEAYETAIEMLSEPERKTGKWIYIDDDNLLYDSYWCSECKKTITVDSERRDDIGITIEDLAFCPNCGARMQEGEDNGTVD